jgi:hypothetical protein
VDLAALLARIGIDRDYSALDLDGLRVDLQGWGSNHEIFADLFHEVRPEVVIELGTWKGASVLWMHGLARELELGTQFVCVDTWLGSSEHWLADDDRQELGLRGGYPTLYRQFVFNVLEAGASNDVFPLPLTSTSAATVLERLGVLADLVYVDAGHDADEVLSDLIRYGGLLRPGGALFGGEYHSRWPGVLSAVEAVRRSGAFSFELVDEQWWVLRREAEQLPRTS